MVCKLVLTLLEEILFSSTEGEKMNTKVGLHTHPPPHTFGALPDGLGRQNFVCNLIMSMSKNEFFSNPLERKHLVGNRGSPI